ncbi:MAG: helix-turn-helix transcriptional regulator [Hyphomicrobiaceae bacterium]
MILCQLADGEKLVGKLAHLLNLREAAISQQLAIFRREHIVEARRDGQKIYYRLANGDVGKLIKFLYKTYCRDITAGKQ